MTRSITRRLIAKDLYLYRWLIAGTMVAGLASIFVSGVEGATGTIGQILFITCIVVLGVFLAIHGSLTERQSKSVLFVLSLPVSPMQYTTAKVAASLIAFLIPWILLTGTIVGFTVALDPPPDGSLPFTIAMMVFLLANFCLLIATSLITGSEVWSVVAIIATNTSVPVFLGTVLPAIAGNTDGPVAVWNQAILTTVATLAALIALALGLAFYIQSRRKDFV